MVFGSRRFWFKLHGWFSLPVWLLFSFVCVTGTIAVMSHEITWITNPEARAENPKNLPKKSMAELVEAVQVQVPDAKVTRIMELEPYLVTAIFVNREDKPPAILYVNPYSAKVQEVNQGLTFIGFMRTLHGWLLFPWHHNYSVGYYLVTLMAFVLMGALISGLVVYKNFWRCFLQPKLRFNQGRQTFYKDFHRLVAVWSIWFFAIMSLTGIWYFVQAVMWHNEVLLWKEPKPISQQVMSQAQQKSLQSPDALSAVLKKSETEFKNFQPKMVSFPEHNRDYFRIAGTEGTFLFDDYSYQLLVNPWNDEVSDVKRPSQMNTLQVISHIADPLHYGTFGGLWSKAIWFVFGLLLSTMSITGFLMWTKRTIIKPKKES
jgi:uncharacterized iron-regulated membrane protein